MQRLTRKHRDLIEWMRECGRTQAEIARFCGVHRSTVSRELRRNAFLGVYRASAAQRLADARLFWSGSQPKGPWQSRSRRFRTPLASPRWRTAWQSDYGYRKVFARASREIRRPPLFLRPPRAASVFSLEQKPVQPAGKLPWLRLLADQELWLMRREAAREKTKAEAPAAEKKRKIFFRREGGRAETASQNARFGFFARRNACRAPEFSADAAELRPLAA